MDPSFTTEEQRFVLAEMIKTSRVDIMELVSFIKTRDLDPEWLAMQVPSGRNLKQCMQLAETLAIQTAQLKRKHSISPAEDASKRRFKPDYETQSKKNGQEQQHSRHSVPANHVAIAPRPFNGVVQGPPRQSTTLAPRKRGRPSRADKAKQDLRPLLPQHLAPRPRSQSPAAPRPILPAVSPFQDHRQSMPPTVNTLSPWDEAKVSAELLHVPVTSHLEPKPAQSLASIPRILPEPAGDSIARNSERPLSSGPVNSDSGAGPASRTQTSSEELTTTLPPLLAKGTATASMSPSPEGRPSLPS